MTTDDLGYLINRSKAQVLTDRALASLVLLALMGVGLFALVELRERLSLPWRPAVVERTDPR